MRFRGVFLLIARLIGRYHISSSWKQFSWEVFKMDLWDCSISLCSSCFASANGSPLSAESCRPLLCSKVFHAINVREKTKSIQSGQLTTTRGHRRCGLFWRRDGSAAPHISGAAGYWGVCPLAWCTWDDRWQRCTATPGLMCNIYLTVPSQTPS